MGRKKVELLKGSIRKRGLKYQVVVPYKDMHGTWKQRTGTCKTMEEAVSMQKRFNNDINVGMNMDDPKFSEVAKMYIDEVRLSNPSVNTIKVYEHCTEFIAGIMGDKKVSAITRTDVVKLYTDIRKLDKEPKIYRAFLNMILNRAVVLKYTSENVAKGVPAERTSEERPPVILSTTERQSLLDNAPNEIMYLATALDFKLGLRVGELFGLRKSDIDIKTGEINVRLQILKDGTLTDKLKSKASKRDIYMDEETIVLMKRLLTLSNPAETSLFPDAYFNRSALSRFLLKFDMIPHDLRHNHATDLLDICNPADAAQRMGHTVEEYIKTYVHTSKEKQKDIATKMNAMYQVCDKSVDKTGGKVIQMARTNA